ncbi:MAG: sigma 54-interacting transcriptional regulator [Kofleriaceae bacterium]
MGDKNHPVPTKVLPRELRFARYRLVVVEGPNPGTTIEGSEEEVSIGSAPGNSLVVDDRTVSRHHVAIAPTPRGHLVRDLGSTNGTYVNGVVIDRAYLAQNATIEIGDARLHFEILSDEESATLSSSSKWGRALGTSPEMRRLFAVLPKLAEAEVTVLLEGETGTGKSLIASVLHEQSPRASGPFVVVDCGAIPPNLIESELFGHEKGAFTGATSSRAGAFEAAKGGTVFLDEIGELPLDMQPRLLRALEERVIKRIGRNDTTPLDIRLIAATNRDLRKEINKGRFRSDLYYRLNTIRLRVPPLRERREDILQLVEHYFEEMGGGEPPASLLTDFSRHDWPGNVRELRAAVERAVLLGDPMVWQGVTDGIPAARDDDNISFRAAKERAIVHWERDYLRALITRHKGNVSHAARAVRMDRNYLRELLARHDIDPEDVKATTR